MAEPERLNVLVSRAKCCLIMIGNTSIFLRSKKGHDTWHKFMQLMKDKQHLYDGLPVQCEQHPEKRAVISTPDGFQEHCPDGGCTEPCGQLLKCGIHNCKRSCYRNEPPHSKTECREPVEKTCDRKHKTFVACNESKDTCRVCREEDKAQQRRAELNRDLERRRLAKQEECRKKLLATQTQIEVEKLKAKYLAEEEDQEKQIEQQAAQLAAIQATNARAQKLREQQQKAKAAALFNASQAPKASPTTNVSSSTSSASLGSTSTVPNSTPATDGVAPASSKTSSPPVSQAAADWQYLKSHEEASSAALDALFALIGLESVKEHFMSLKALVDTRLRQGLPLNTDRLGAVLLGNPGTGKTTVARLYGAFLAEVGAVPGAGFVETTGAKLAADGVKATEKAVSDLLAKGGGVFFIDEAYQLTSGNNPGGAAVLDYLLAEVENLNGKIVFVLAGYRKNMESFFAHNPGLPSRFPVQMRFDDYSDEELRMILEANIARRFKGKMKVEDGPAGLYCRIVARRVGRGRGREGFGNARAVENALDVIGRRQTRRLTRERRAAAQDKSKPVPDDLFMTKEDLIGPEPAAALESCAAWKKLQALVGLELVKKSVAALVDTVQQNYQQELNEMPLIEYSLNKVFLGNPGTGKTTVAKLYGTILNHIGLLSRDEVVIKNPADFVGAVIGASEQNTKAILESTAGKVLVIDEAYGLYAGGNNHGSKNAADQFRVAVIDTIVAEVQSVPGEDRCVLLCGYRDVMEAMFDNVNPGLARRFPLASAFEFEDFTPAQLRSILDLKLSQQGFRATGQAVDVALEMLERARNRPKFGNAGEIDILLDRAKLRQRQRLSSTASSAVAKSLRKLQKQQGGSGLLLLEASDFDPDWDRAKRAATNIRALFAGTVGTEAIVA